MKGQFALVDSACSILKASALAHTKFEFQCRRACSHQNTMLMQVRPPVMHDFGFLVNGAVPKAAPIQIFQHRLLQQYCLSIFCKLPIAPIQRLSGLRRGLLVRMLISVLTFRINSRYSEPGSRFLGIELDISDSAREGCIVSTLTITSEAGDWRPSTQVRPLS